jgi:hypothetical protein
VNYQAVADDLSKKIDAFVINLNRVDTKVQGIHDDIQNTAKELDFEIPQNPHIIELQVY